MTIYMIKEGCMDHNVMAYMGAYTTREAALKAIEIKGKEDSEWLEALIPQIIEVELH